MGGVVLVGPMGSGKTEVGRLVARALGRPFVDTDWIVSQAAGRTIEEIFESEGEAGFREREAVAVREAARVEEAVIACGGGAVLRSDNVRVLRGAGTVVYLHVDAEKAAKRIGSGAGRPLLGIATIAEIIAGRDALYRAAADETVDAGGSPQEVATLVLEKLG